MLDCDVHAQILGVRPPWSLTGVNLDMKGQENGGGDCTRLGEPGFPTCLIY